MNQFKTEYQTYCDSYGQPEHIELILADLNGILRGKWLPAGSVDKLIKQNVRLPLSTCAPNILGTCVPKSGVGIIVGDPDGILVPIENTLTPVPWSDGRNAQVLVDMTDLHGNPTNLSARHILQSILSRFDAKGLKPVVATELEFYIFEERASKIDAPVPPKHANFIQNYDLEVLSVYQPILDDILDAARKQNLPTDTLISEYGAGQFEINFHHTDDVLAAADTAILFKRIVRETAKKHGMEASFMAKPYADMPGNGMHMHISVLNENGANIFDGKDSQINAKLRQSIAGLINTMADLQAIFAPHANSYRRFQPGSFAPSSPSWAQDNRDAGIRIPDIKGPAARLEHRICGADVNPYLAISAVLGGILHGLEKEPVLPEPLKIGETDQAQQLCADWQRALNRFAHSDLAADIFGSHYRDLYVAVKQDEIEKLLSIIAPMEYQYYLSRF